MQAEELLRDGMLPEALSALQEQIRNDPADAKLRVFLFQLLSVLGQWDKAMTQLNVAAEMDSANLLMAQLSRYALNCEAFRKEVFAGGRTPLIFGEPAEWVSLLVQANQLLAGGKAEAAAELRDQAFEAAPGVSGTVNDEPFEWIADADNRLGPVLEGMIDGRYYWIPFDNIREITMEEPTDLRDLVWTPARFVWSNGGDAVGLIPTRYPSSEQSQDAAILLSRKTDWVEAGGEFYLGQGQRQLATDAAEYSLAEVRHVVLETECATAEAGADAPAQEAEDG